MKLKTGAEKEKLVTWDVEWNEKFYLKWFLNVLYFILFYFIDLYVLKIFYCLNR
jgi:hypothetical protein